MKTRKMMTTLMALLLTLLLANASAQGAIDRTTAEDLALHAAGVAREQATMLTAERENERGTVVYDVEFRSGGLEYEYWIDENTGGFLRRAWEFDFEKLLELAARQDASAGVLSESDALSLALADAGVAEDAATLVETTLDSEDGLRLYEICFFTEAVEYEYDLDAVTGEVCGLKVEYFEESESLPEQKVEGQALTRSEARDLALDNAGVSAEQATFTKSKLDYEDGVLVYEIEFVTDQSAYEYEIDAATGEILERSVETRASGASGAKPIDLSEAKRIALRHAGLTEGEVTFSEAKREKDDGEDKFEIEFRAGNIEYEYEIDAATGSILEYGRERDD